MKKDYLKCEKCGHDGWFIATQLQLTCAWCRFVKVGHVKERVRMQSPDDCPPPGLKKEVK